MGSEIYTFNNGKRCWFLVFLITLTYQVPTRIWSRLLLVFSWFTLPKGGAGGGFEWGSRVLIYWVWLFLSKEGERMCRHRLFHFPELLSLTKQYKQVPIFMHMQWFLLLCRNYNYSKNQIFFSLLIPYSNSYFLSLKINLKILKL